MKKTILFVMAALFAVTMNAQSVNDDLYVGLKGGASGLVHPGCNGYENFGHTIEGLATLEFGKWITPSVAFGIESTAGFENGSKFGRFQGKNWLNYVDVLAVTKLNLNNVFRGYRGYADKVEFVPSVGIGWVHGFTYGATEKTNHTNDIMTKFAFDVAYNVGKHVQLNFTPFLSYNLTGGYQGKNSPRFDSRNAWWGVEAGVAYKFGKGLRTCGKYTQDDIDALNAKIDELRNRTAEVQYVEREKIVEKEKVVEKPVYKDIVIDFRNNSWELESYQQAILRTIPAGFKVSIVGSATKFGSIWRNDELAKNRAKVVADYLKARGVEVVDCKGVGTELNGRVAIVKIQ